MAQNIPPVDLKAAFTDHDRLFKELLSVFFLDFVDLFLPDVAGYIDRESIVFLGTEVFTNISTAEKHIVDILARARFRGEEAYFLLHVENQAKAQADFAERMFYYFADLGKSHRLPVYPIALLTYDRPLRAEPSEYRVTFPDFEPLHFRYRAIQLNRLNWRDFLNKPNPIAAALMAKMNIARADRPKVKSECLRLLATLKLDPARTQLIAGFIDSYLKLSAQEMREFTREIESLPKEEQDAIMPLTISWKEEGRAEGQAEGRAEGERRMLLVAAERRLGKPTAEAAATLAAIDSSERLEHLMSRLFTVESWDDLLADA